MRHTVLQPGRNGRESTILDAVQFVGRLTVRSHGRGVPETVEALHQVAAADDLRAGVAHHLDSAGVDARDVRDGIARRVLHGHPGQPPEQGLQP